MKNPNFKRLLSFVMALSMVVSFAAMPAAATEETTGETTAETTAETTHTCSYTVETVTAPATCGQAGEKKLSCSFEGCEEFTTETIPATGEHTYEDSVCTGCEAPQPCDKTLDCGAATHERDCVSQCSGAVTCTNSAHKEGCLSQAECTCIRLCSETKACPLCIGEGECKGGEAADKIAAVQALIDALPTRYTAEEREAAFAQYQACTDAIAALTEEQRNALNLENYYAAAQPVVIPSDADSMQGLIDALNGGATEIILSNSFAISETIEISNPVTLDLNNKTITNDVKNGYLFQVTDSLTIQGSTGSIVSGEESGKNLVLNNGKMVTIMGGSFDGTFAADGSSAVIAIANGNFTSFNATIQNGGTLNIIGGTFDKDIRTLLTIVYTQDGNGKVVRANPSACDPAVTASNELSNTGTTAQLEFIAALAANTAVNTANAALDNTLVNKINNDDLEEAIENLAKNQAVKTETELTRMEVTLKLEVKALPLHASGTGYAGITYDVSPVIQAAVGEGSQKRVLAKEPISELTQDITVTLPVPFDVKYVNLKHIHTDTTTNQDIITDLGDIAVQGTGTNKYITITTDSFSDMVITPKTGETLVAKVIKGNNDASYTSIEDAITALTTDGGTLELLTDITTGSTLSIPTGKTAVVNLKGFDYTYTGTGAVFANTGVLTIQDTAATKGSVVANTGTLITNIGTLTISDIAYTSTATTGNTVENSGTATINSGSFTGNEKSVSSTGTVTINGGTFNSALSGTITIPGNSTARFKEKPADNMLPQHYSAVVVTSTGMYGIQEDPYVTVGTNNTKYYYAAGENLDTILTNTPDIQTIKLSREEALNRHHTLTANTAAIDFAGFLIKGEGSITAGSTVYLNNIGPNKLRVVLGAGDKVVFGTDGSITITAAENKNATTNYGYGNIMLEIPYASGSTLPITYFLAKDAHVKVTSTGGISTKGQVINGSGLATIPDYKINQINDGSNNFVIGSSKTMTFYSNGFYDGFSSVTVNGNVLSTSYYTKTNDDGAVIVTLSNTYLKSLTKGKYEFKIHFLDGGYASANFYVAKTASIATNPKTGDTIMTTVGIMAVAAVGLAALLYIGKKKKQ